MHKKVSIGFGFLALFFTVLLVIPRFVTLNHWKADIEKQISLAIDRSVHIDGNINISILPYPGVTLERVRIANDTWAQKPDIISADEVTVAVTLLPLITKTIEFSQVSLVKPNIHLEVSQEGIGNWTAIVKDPDPLEQASHSKEKTESSWTIKNTIPRINIREGALSYTNQQGTTTEITHFHTALKTDSVKGPFSLTGGLSYDKRDLGFKISTEEFSQKAPTPINIELSGLGQSIQIIGKVDQKQKDFQGQLASKIKLSDFIENAGPLSGELTLTADIRADATGFSCSNLSLSDKKFKAEGNASLNISQGLVYSMSLSGFPGGTSFKLKSPDKAETGLTGIVDFVSEDTPALLSWIAPEAGIPLQAKRSSLHSIIQQEGDRYTFSPFTLELDDTTVKGNLEIAYPKITAKLVASDFKGLLEALKVEAPGNIKEAQFSGSVTLKERTDLDVDLSFAGGHIKTKGNYTRLSKSYYFDLDINYPNLKGLLSAFNLQSKGFNIGATNLRLNLTGSDEHIAINDIEGSLGPNNSPMKLDGSATIDLKNSKKAIVAKINLGHVQLDQFLKTASLETTNQYASKELENEEAPKSHWPTEKLDLSVLNDYDADLDLNIEKLSYQNARITQLKMPLKLENSKLSCASLHGSMYDGALSMSFNLETGKAHNLDIKSTLKNANLEKIVSAIAGNHISGGNLDVDLDLKTQGASISELISNLQGSHNIIATQGSILGVDIENVVKKIKSLMNPQALLGLFENSKGATPFSKITSRSTVRKGVSQFEALSIEAPQISGQGGGAINLPKSNVNISMDVSLLALEEVPPVKLTVAGPISSPKTDYDISQLRNALFKKVGGKVINRLLEGSAGNVLGDAAGDNVGNVLDSVLSGFNKKDNTNESPKSEQTQPQPPQEQTQNEEITPEKAVKGLLKNLF